MIVFIGGKKERREFLEITRDVCSIASRYDATVVERDGFSADASLCRVDFFILLRSYPNEFTAGDVERLRRCSPLAPIVIIDGTLCEGEGRTGDALYGTRRFYPSRWRSSGIESFERFFSPSGATGPFAAPATASDVELRMVQGGSSTFRSSDDVSDAPLAGERTLILTEDDRLARFLAVGFASRGATTMTSSLDGALTSDAFLFMPTRVVVDVVDEFGEFPSATGGLLRRLQALHEACGDARFDLLVFAPNAVEYELLEGQSRPGRVRVLPKPFDIATLFDVCRAF